MNLNTNPHADEDHAIREQWVDGVDYHPSPLELERMEAESREAEAAQAAEEAAWAEECERFAEPTSVRAFINEWLGDEAPAVAWVDEVHEATPCRSDDGGTVRAAVTFAGGRKGEIDLSVDRYPGTHLDPPDVNVIADWWFTPTESTV